MESVPHPMSAPVVRPPDDFDAYFARAAKDASCHSPAPLNRNHNGSGQLDSPCGTMGPSLCVRENGATPRRSVSCKYPSRKKSLSPRRGSPTASPASPTAKTTADTGLCAPLLGVWSRSSSSAPQSRSSSWKKMKRPPSLRGPASADPNHPHHRHLPQGGRTSPSWGSGNLEQTIIGKLEQLQLMKEADCCVVRSFNTSPRGDIVAKFDNFMRISNASDVRASDVDHHVTGSGVHLPPPGARTGNGHSVRPAPNGSCGSGEVCKVVVIGLHHVGKTALIQQFMTSHYMAAVCTSFDDEADKTICVALNGEETMINFVDAGSPSTTSQDYLDRTDVNAYILVYSITAAASFHYACEVLCNIRCSGRGGGGGGGGVTGGQYPVVILVANKSDLVRTRQVTEAEAKYVCSCLDCKYIEVSASLNHRVDELLVGIVRQIKRNRYNGHRQMAYNAATTTPPDDENRKCMKGAKELLKELFKGDFCLPPSANCDNLFDL